MAIVPRNLRNGKTAYWVTFDWNGSTRWEHGGFDKRGADRLEAQRKKEVRAGTYSPQQKRAGTVESWFSDYLGKRANRTVENDRALVRNHVLCRGWLAGMAMTDVRPRHCLRLVEEMRKEGKLGEKSIATVYSVVVGAFRRALFDELISDDPTKLPKGALRWKSARANKRKPYTRQEAHAFTTHAKLLPEQIVWNALAVYSGMREGEVCGRRWKDWRRDWEPLSALEVHSQYEDQPLKTDDGEDTRPRTVPVHPDLETVLRWWWSEGFELVHRRAPTLDDFIVPSRAGGCHTKSSAYKMFQRALKVCEVENRTLHATRHTFISVARSNGARHDVLERVTHNARGETIDGYTTFEWRALCEAVVVFDLDLDRKAFAATFRAPAPGLESGASVGSEAKASEEPRKLRLIQGGGKPAAIGLPDALFDASQRRALKLAEIDPEAARPVLAVLRGLASTLRGDVEGAVDELRKEAEATHGPASGGGRP
jgi:integrase